MRAGSIWHFTLRASSGLDVVPDTESGITHLSHAGDGHRRARPRSSSSPPKYFDESVLADNKIGYAGTFSLWLRYKKQPTTPPSAGFSSCNGSAKEYTCWQRASN